ncbi:MAG: tetratricopeptide repeat protein [Myxococcales bacterium]|nr:tetratricopeptide repeat protein [Myxococcales bacterium]MCB9532944.1 tetratricopeptide repeat protein [Myxococcales bacterium]
MLNVALSLLSAVAVTALIGAVFGKVAYGIVPGLIAGGVAWYYLGRRVMTDIEQRMAAVQEILRPKNPMKPTKPRFDDAIAVLVGALKWRRWHPFITGQIEGQIGQLYFLDQRFVDAQPYLERSTPRNWVAKAMLGVLHFKQRQPEQMVAAFEQAVKYSEKESLLWNIYAWCHHKREDRDAAIAVLVRAMQHVGTDERTQKNLFALQNGKGMKMRGWAEMWYQFHLEKPAPVELIPQRPVSKRAMYRGR